MTQLHETGELIEMLSYARPHGSNAETAFVQRYIMPIAGLTFDKFGNGMVKIGNSPIVWSSHTDTVHKKGGKQKIVLTGGIVSLANKTPGSCLGADDGAGIWIMLGMIHAQIPGLYIFHAGEEVGGIGSSWISQNTPERLTGHRAAIAFDRKGTSSVITHQMIRTCSDPFGHSLARFLGPLWELDDTGTFTDTANYTNLIGECTNLSVGYENQHGPNETLDLIFLQTLYETMIHFDPDVLTYTREPGDIDPDEFDDVDLNWQMPANSNWATTFAKGDDWQSQSDQFGSAERRPRVTEYHEDLIELISEYPHLAAKLITQLGGNIDDMDYLIDKEENP